MTKEVMQQALDALVNHVVGDSLLGGVKRASAIAALYEALAEPTPMTQARAKDLAYRRCKRYVFIDTEAPYQFNGHTLMDFVRDVEANARDVIIKRTP